jgi:plastocyanin
LFHGNGRNEGNLSDLDIADMVSAGGAFAPRLPAAADTSEADTFPSGSTVAPFECGGTSESWVQVYRYYVDQLRRGRLINGDAPFVGIGIGTDMGPPIPTFTAPRFKLPPGQRRITATPVPLEDYPDTLVRMFLGPSVPGACFNDGERSKVNYPLANSRLAPSDVSFPKSNVPWDSATYDINYDGVPHVGMLPDFIEELTVLGLSKEDLDPVWRGAEAYLRTWEASESFASAFDLEGTRGVRDACEQQRGALLDALDSSDADAAIAALRGIRNNLCRTVDYTDRGTDGVVTMPISGYTFGVARPYIVPVGTTVKVVNNDGVNHTWTSNDGLFNASLPANGGSATHTFTEAGIYDFYCSDHPVMRNTIVVR